MFNLVSWAVISAAVLSAASPPSYSVVARLPAGDGGWDLASVDPVDHRLYVARSSGVLAIDLATETATDQLVPGQRVHAALAIPGSHDVISTNGMTNNATLFDGRTGQVRATIPTGQKPDAAAYDPATRTVWIMNAGSGDVTVVDPESAQIVGTVPVGGSLELGAADGNGRMYVNVEDRNEVVAIDTHARKVVARYALQGCDGPTGIAYDSAAKQILSACGNGVAIITARGGHRVASLPIGKGADGAAYDATRHLALVPGGKDGNLTLIRLGRNPAIVGQVATAISARTIAIDPSTGRAYLPSSDFVPTVGSERAKAVPGTFRVVVVAPKG